MRKGDVASPIIMWMGAILAGGIVLVWYLQHISPGQVTISRMDDDLERIHEQVNLACQSESSSSSVTIRSEGTFLINSSVLCIRGLILGKNETRCIPTSCAVQPASFPLHQGRIGVRRNGGVVSVQP